MPNIGACPDVDVRAGGYSTYVEEAWVIITVGLAPVQGEIIAGLNLAALQADFKARSPPR